MTSTRIICTVVFLAVWALFAAIVLRQLKKGNPLRQFRVMDPSLKALSFRALGISKIEGQSDSYVWDGMLAYSLIPGFLIIRKNALLFLGKSYFRIPLDCVEVDADPELGCIALSTEEGVLKWDAGSDLTMEIRAYTGS